MIKFVEIPVGSGGLPQCGRCRPQTGSRFRSAAEITADAMRVADEWCAGPGPNLSFTGAEPFLHPQLPELVASAREAGAQRIRLTTGATALAQGQNAAGSLDAGVRQIEVVLLSGEPAVHDDLVGRKGALSSALAGVRAFCRAAEERRVQVAVTARIPVCRHNSEFVASAIGSIGAVGGLAASVEPAPETDFTPDAPWVAAVADTGMVNTVWVAFVGWPPWVTEMAGAHAHMPWSVASGVA